MITSENHCIGYELCELKHDPRDWRYANFFGVSPYFESGSIEGRRATRSGGMFYAMLLIDNVSSIFDLSLNFYIWRSDRQ